MSEKLIYKVTLVSHEQIYELYVKNVYQSELYGFVVIENFVFGEKSAIVVDPSEEKLRIEFEGVERSFIPAHKIIRIDQVKQQGKAKIVAAGKSEGEAGTKVSMLFRPDKS
ncbi:DUF1820 family protein [Methylovulum psychrotolerans]|jgi:hypothetical protein|uniref:DUF1820 domain-containing protein n=1 Tax=Methylovulum psychrotolerans TaxID=1704499 RepID=A0A1Z4BUI9_9GAMM|nr:DUF1820 family protein [Methylovulum psychrotolerans]ASF44869.1 hypothetical protein CEK71_01645 [Methylovulum psychrotolerans]MBT9098336.1 DUF1820 family protein [Methylovulum psychrotolerans]